MEQSERYKQALLKSIQREWNALMAVVEGLSPAQMITPVTGEWSPKDILAHITQWLKILIGYHIDHKSAQQVLGMPDALAENFDLERVNAYLFEQNRHRSGEDVLAELKDQYAVVLARLEAMSLDELMQPGDARDPGKSPLVFIVLDNTSEHFAEHRATLQQMLK